MPLAIQYLDVYSIAGLKNGSVLDHWVSNMNMPSKGWNLFLRRGFNDWELEQVSSLTTRIDHFRISETLEEDEWRWLEDLKEKFTVSSAYSFLSRSNDIVFPANFIWIPILLTKVGFFMWLVDWNRVPTIDLLMSKGFQWPNRCELC